MSKTRAIYSLPRAQQAVAVVRDALQRIRYRTTRTGYYFCSLSPCSPAAADKLRWSNLWAVSEKIERTCQVCAKGSLVLSYARLLGGVPTGLVLDYNQCTLIGRRRGVDAVLRTLFSRVTLCLVECAFECSPHFAMGHAPQALREAAAQFGSHYADPQARLRAILKNSIKNNGKFMPLVPHRQKGRDAA